MEIDRIHDWNECVKRSGNFLTNYAVSQFYSTQRKNVHSAEGSKVSKLGYKYSKGIIRTPHSTTFDKAKKIWPEARYWFDMPFWEVITTSMTQDRIDALLAKSSLKIQKKLFRNINTTNGLLIRIKYRSGAITHLGEWLFKQNTLEAFNVLILLLAECDLHKKDYLSRHICSRYIFNYLRNFYLVKAGHPFATRFLQYIKARFIYNWDTEEAKKIDSNENRILDFINLKALTFTIDSLEKYSTLCDWLMCAIEDYGPCIEYLKKNRFKTLLFSIDSLSGSDKILLFDEVKDIIFTQKKITSNKNPLLASLIEYQYNIDIDEWNLENRY